MMETKKGKMKLIIIISIISSIVMYILISMGIYNYLSNKILNDNNILDNNKEEDGNDKNSEFDFEKIREKRYSKLFGKDSLGIIPPQTFTCNNMIIFNENKNDRIIVTSVERKLSTGNPLDGRPTFIYLLDEEDDVLVTIDSFDNKFFALQETIDGVEIYTYSDKTDRLDAKRFIPLDDVPYPVSNAKYKYYIVLEPTREIKNSDVLEIIQNIKVDKTKNEVKEQKTIIVDENELVNKIENITIDLKNVMVDRWRIGNSGINTIKFYLDEKERNNNNYIEFVIPMNESMTLDYLKESIKEENDSKYNTLKTRLVDINIDGKLFYCEEFDNKGKKYFSEIYMELQNGRLIKFNLSYETIKDENSIRKFIEEKILNNILFFD